MSHRDSFWKNVETSSEGQDRTYGRWLQQFYYAGQNGNPKVALHIENEMRWAMKKYKKLHPDKPLPHITPHVFRHTFCTNYANDGMDIKNLQYLMSHSNAGFTLNVYTRKLRTRCGADDENRSASSAFWLGQRQRTNCWKSSRYGGSILSLLHHFVV